MGEAAAVVSREVSAAGGGTRQDAPSVADAADWDLSRWGLRTMMVQACGPAGSSSSKGAGTEAAVDGGMRGGEGKGSAKRARRQQGGNLRWVQTTINQDLSPQA